MRKKPKKTTELQCLLETQRYHNLAHESQEWWQYFFIIHAAVHAGSFILSWNPACNAT